MIVPANVSSIEDAARLLRAGGLVAFPTETVYGLGADATNGMAVARIFEAKGRPRFNPLIVHVADPAAAKSLAEFDKRSEALAERFWPGALTLVLPKKFNGKPQLSELVTAGLGTVAVRVPSHPVARALLQSAAVPIAAPSANISGRVSPTKACHVRDDLGGRVDLILEGEAPNKGLESTIVGLFDEAVLLRPGAIPRGELEAALGARLASPRDHTILSPGQLQSHYAPQANLRLNAVDAKEGEVLLGFGPGADRVALNLSASGDLREAAANLFAYLRELDAVAPAGIAVMPIPETGIGEAINDRLRRAAAPRANE